VTQLLHLPLRTQAHAENRKLQLKQSMAVPSFRFAGPFLTLLRIESHAKRFQCFSYAPPASAATSIFRRKHQTRESVRSSALSAKPAPSRSLAELAQTAEASSYVAPFGRQRS
jgi:hypothetical protein